tara:strand:- start:602 stop:1399 length:798 start_codon:yes stop_codon:yes gene_type:complete
MPRLDAVAWQAILLLDGKRDLLTGSQSKLNKATAQATGYVNRGLTMSPANEASEFLDRYNACHGSSPACVFACVGAKTGQGRLKSSEIARIGRSIVLDIFPKEFRRLLGIEIKIAELQAMKSRATLAFRTNVATDNHKLADALSEEFPSVVFYDYSAIPSAVRSQTLVRRVYSLKEGPKRMKIALDLLNEGLGLAVVFAIPSRSSEPLPKTWNGVPVIDGDENDLWFTRAPKVGPFVVGLKVKGNKAQVDEAISKGFAVQVGVEA